MRLLRRVLWAATIALIFLSLAGVFVWKTQPAFACQAVTGVTQVDSGTSANVSVDLPKNMSFPQAVKAYTIDHLHSPRLMAMIMFIWGSESSFGANTPHGPAFGPIAIEQPGVVNLGITVAQANDYAFVLKYRMPAFVESIKAINPSMWADKSQWQTAISSAAYAAQKPAAWAIVAQRPNVPYLYSTALAILRSQGVSTDFTTDTATYAATTAPAAATSATSTPVTPLPAMCNPYSNLGFASDASQKVIAAAVKYYGYPFVWGGGGTNGPTKSTLSTPSGAVGFDFSGLTQYAYHQAGIELPRQVADQYNNFITGHRTIGQEQPGDLIFFSVQNGSPPNQVGIVVDPSKHQMIGSSSIGTKISYSDYTKAGSIVGIVHLLPDNSTGGPPATGKGLVGNDGFPGGSCALYVRYIGLRHVTGYPFFGMGDGGDVAANLGQNGFTITHSDPHVHDVVSFSRAVADHYHGHVAFVAEVYPDGSFLAEEANWTNSNRYGTHKVSASLVKSGQLTFARTSEKWHDNVTIR